MVLGDAPQPLFLFLLFGARILGRSQDTLRAHHNSENSEILTLPDFQIGRLFETLTLKIGRKQFAENLCFTIHRQKTDLKIRENTSQPTKNSLPNFQFPNSEG